MKKILFLLVSVLPLCQACRQQQSDEPQRGDALISYVERFPECEPQDLYKMVFQDLYGPGHIISDSASCAGYILHEVETMDDCDRFPLYEYTLPDSHYVRVNLVLVKRGLIGTEELTSAVLRSVQQGRQPDMRFHMSHSQRFKAAYDPHYRIVRRDIFEREIMPLLHSGKAHQ